MNGGLDLGYNLGKKTFLILGYRYGQQDQYKRLGVGSPYDSTYHRVLLGIEGSPASWLELAVLGGPDIRSFYHKHELSQPPYSGFDRNEMLYWIDATVTLLPSKQDGIALLNRRADLHARPAPEGRT